MKKNILPSSSDKPDPFNLLEDNLLIVILSLIECTTRELIRTTATISRRWRKLWAEVPHHIFQDEDDDVDPTKNIQPLISSINHTISQCPTVPNLRLFNLHTVYDPEVNPEFKTQVNSWIHYAIRRKVQMFDLLLWKRGTEEFTYRDELFFNSSCITDIKISWCFFKPPNHTISWKRLKSLYISYSTLYEGKLEMVLSGSPCLESLTLEDCYGYELIDITSKSVKKLVFTKYNSCDQIPLDKEYIDCLQINAPYISSLTIEGYLQLRKLSLLDVSLLAEVVLDYFIGWSKKSQEAIFRRLWKRLSHARDIKLGAQLSKIRSRMEASNDSSNDDDEDEEEDSESNDLSNDDDGDEEEDNESNDSSTDDDEDEEEDSD